MSTIYSNGISKNEEINKCRKGEESVVNLALNWQVEHWYSGHSKLAIGIFFHRILTFLNVNLEPGVRWPVQLVRLWANVNRHSSGVAWRKWILWCSETTNILRIGREDNLVELKGSAFDNQSEIRMIFSAMGQKPQICRTKNSLLHSKSLCAQNILAKNHFYYESHFKVVSLKSLADFSFDCWYNNTSIHKNEIFRERKNPNQNIADNKLPWKTYNCSMHTLQYSTLLNQCTSLANDEFEKFVKQTRKQASEQTNK